MTTILEEAARITSGDRNKSYGNPRDNHARTAVLWSAYLKGKAPFQVRITPDDVCYLNILQKISRLMHDPDHRDSWVDIAGYARNLEMMRDNPFDEDIITETFAPLEDLKVSRAARKPSGYVYLACPYTHDDRDERIRRVHAATSVAAYLMGDECMVVFSPITHGHAIAAYLEDQYASAHDFWMAQCLPFLANADFLYVLQMPGWTLSKGVQLEMDYAKEHGIPIRFIPWNETEL